MPRPQTKPWWTVPAAPSDRPHYIALRDHIARNIGMGGLAAGSKLPSERQLQIGTGSARGTVREALFQLEAEGLIFRKDRSGWYVSSPPITYDPTRWAGFMTYVTEQGRTPATETLSKEAQPAHQAVADIFGYAAGAPLYVIRRRRLIDAHPVLVERIVVDPKLAPGLLDHSLDGSLTQILKTRFAVSVTRNRVDMQPCALLADVADALGVKSGAPGLLVVRTSFNEAGKVVEYDHEYWRHDAVRVHVDLSVRDEPPQ